MSVLQEVKPMDPAGFLGMQKQRFPLRNCDLWFAKQTSDVPLVTKFRNGGWYFIFPAAVTTLKILIFSTAADAVSLPTVLQYQHHLSRQSCIQLRKNAPDTGTLQQKIVFCTLDFFWLVEALAKLKYWDRRVSTQLCKFWHRLFSIFHNWSKDLLESHPVGAKLLSHGGHLPHLRWQRLRRAIAKTARTACAWPWLLRQLRQPKRRRFPSILERPACSCTRGGGAWGDVMNSFDTLEGTCWNGIGLLFGDKLPRITDRQSTRCLQTLRCSHLNQLFG